MEFSKIIKALEKFLAERPILFWILTTIIPLVTSAILFDQIKTCLVKDLIVKGYVLPICAMSLILLFLIYHRWSGSYKKAMLKELEVMRLSLHEDYIITSTTLGATFYYYPNFTLETFDRYKQVAAALKKRYPSEFGNLVLRETPIVKDNDWVPLESMLPLRNDIDGLILRLT